ncbi:MAG: hypothetical protein FK733_10330 [Asgard group archaeon]|nr:hypothetical protein [Asgard group archaeon]
MSGLDTLWIINKNGLCLLQQAFDSSKDPTEMTMFSSFITALLNFSDSIFNDQFEHLVMGKLDVHCLSFSNGKFLVVLATKKGSKISNLREKITEIGDAFEVEFGDQLDKTNAVYTEVFLPFSETIDNIFGTKTIRILPEHENFLDLLKRAETENYSENHTIEVILDFFEQLSTAKRKVLLQSTLPILSIFIESPNLTKEQTERIQVILQ